uniref:Uncharacterized protein n=1 Tax=Oncorhynchus tshawytscha TaxID=74940 RepID=A0A8C8IE38_ONCTS
MTICYSFSYASWFNGSSMNDQSLKLVSRPSRCTASGCRRRTSHVLWFLNT